MNMNTKTVKLGGREYTAAELEAVIIKMTDANELDKTYKIVRCQSAGVFAGEIESKDGTEVTMTNARRLWYWDGAASLSDMAVNGVSKPGNCKFPPAVPKITLTGVIEIIDCTVKARRSIESVKEWTQH